MVEAALVAAGAGPGAVTATGAAAVTDGRGSSAGDSVGAGCGGGGRGLILPGDSPLRIGARCTVRQKGQRTSWPAWVCSTSRRVLQT
jgi:hypothetical protein